MSELLKTLYGVDLFGDHRAPTPSGKVAEQFTFPPFSVLDARSGEWQKRKKTWSDLGIQGEVGRGENLIQYSSTVSLNGGKDTSIFDPTLCECIYRWFSPEGGQIVDPFAGGSVRGIVAGMLKRNYWGCELREEQVESNYQQAFKIQPPIFPIWVMGDSLKFLDYAPKSDLIFSCPPIWKS